MKTKVLPPCSELFNGFLVGHLTGKATGGFTKTQIGKSAAHAWKYRRLFETITVLLYHLWWNCISLPDNGGFFIELDRAPEHQLLRKRYEDVAEYLTLLLRADRVVR